MIPKQTLETILAVWNPGGRRRFEKPALQKRQIRWTATSTRLSLFCGSSCPGHLEIIISTDYSETQESFWFLDQHCPAYLALGQY